MSFLELKNVNYGYKNSFHLENVNFSVVKGQFTGIIGPNGSGKSTLIKGISGEINVSRNQVFLNNIDLSHT